MADVAYGFELWEGFKGLELEQVEVESGVGGVDAELPGLSYMRALRPGVALEARLLLGPAPSLGRFLAYVGMGGKLLADSELAKCSVSFPGETIRFKGEPGSGVNLKVFLGEIALALSAGELQFRFAGYDAIVLDTKFSAGAGKKKGRLLRCGKCVSAETLCSAAAARAGFPCLGWCIPDERDCVLRTRDVLVEAVDAWDEDYAFEGFPLRVHEFEPHQRQFVVAAVLEGVDPVRAVEFAGAAAFMQDSKVIGSPCVANEGVRGDSVFPRVSDPGTRRMFAEWAACRDVLACVEAGCGQAPVSGKPPASDFRRAVAAVMTAGFPDTPMAGEFAERMQRAVEEVAAFGRARWVVDLCALSSAEDRYIDGFVTDQAYLSLLDSCGSSGLRVGESEAAFVFGCFYAGDFRDRCLGYAREGLDDGSSPSENCRVAYVTDREGAALTLPADGEVEPCGGALVARCGLEEAVRGSDAFIVSPIVRSRGFRVVGCEKSGLAYGWYVAEKGSGF